jgi:hypothetical protein
LEGTFEMSAKKPPLRPEDYDRIPVKVRKIGMEKSGMKITWEPQEGAVAYEVPGDLDRIVYALVPKEADNG